VRVSRANLSHQLRWSNGSARTALKFLQALLDFVQDFFASAFNESSVQDVDQRFLFVCRQPVRSVNDFAKLERSIQGIVSCFIKIAL
jgi:hypothetical protein